MPQDEDGEQTISFTEYMRGIGKAAQTPHPGFKFSQVCFTGGAGAGCSKEAPLTRFRSSPPQGIVATTKEENRRIIDEIHGLVLKHDKINHVTCTFL